MAARVIVVTSGKGGVGKTTTTANISVALARSGFKVVAIDADIGLRNLDVMMGLENRIVYTFVDVLDGVCRLPQALVRDKRVDSLYLLPAVFAGIGVNLVSHVVIRHLNLAESRFERDDRHRKKS